MSAGFVTLSRLVHTFLDHNIRYGTWSFDVIIARCLSVVLVSLLGCRGGDVARSTRYTSAEYLHYKHVELYLQQAGAATAAAGGAGEYPQFQDLQAVITLDYSKDHKNKHNISQIKYLRPFNI